MDDILIQIDDRNGAGKDQGLTGPDSLFGGDGWDRINTPGNGLFGGDGWDRFGDHDNGLFGGDGADVLIEAKVTYDDAGKAPDPAPEEDSVQVVGLGTEAGSDFGLL